MKVIMAISIEESERNTLREQAKLKNINFSEYIRGKIHGRY